MNTAPMSNAPPVSLSHPIDINPANHTRQMGAAADDQQLSLSIEKTKHYWDDFRSPSVSQPNAPSQLGFSGANGPGSQQVEHQMDSSSEMNQDLEPMQEMAPHTLPQEPMTTLLAPNSESDITFGTFGSEKELPQKAEAPPQPPTTGLEILNANSNNEMIDPPPESNLNSFMSPSFVQTESSNIFNAKEIDTFEPPSKEDDLEPNRADVTLFDSTANKMPSTLIPAAYTHKASAVRYPSVLIATQPARPATLDASQYPLHLRSNEPAFAYHTPDLPSRLIQPAAALPSMPFPSALPEQQGIQYGFSQSTAIPQSPPMLNTQQSLTPAASYLPQSATQQSFSAAFPSPYPSVLSTSISQMVPNQSYVPFGSSRGDYGGGGSVLMKPSSVTKTVASLPYPSVPSMPVNGNSIYGQVSSRQAMQYCCVQSEL